MPLSSTGLISAQFSAEVASPVAVGAGRQAFASKVSEPRPPLAASRCKAPPRVPSGFPKRTAATAELLLAVGLRRVGPLPLVALSAVLVGVVGRPPGGGPELDAPSDESICPTPSLGRARKRTTSS